MALSEKDAIDKLRELRDADKKVRPSRDSYWTLAIAYDTGNQWAYATTRQGALVLNQLRNIIDPQREDVRVTMNAIHKQVVRIGAALKPKVLSCYAKEASGAMQDRIVADASNELIERWASRIGALQILREKEPIRDVLGAVLIRRTLFQRGQGRQLGKIGDQELSIRNFQIGWDIVYPWEIIRDPAATTLNFARDEDFIAQFKPKSLGWVKRNFGVDLRNGDDAVQSTMGELMEFQKQLHRARSSGEDVRLEDSKEKGVLVYDAYYKDPDSAASDDPRLDWAHNLIAWCDIKNDPQRFHTLRFGANPFYGNPFHMFACDTSVQAPWPRGIPHMLMQGQDVINIAFTWLLRMMQSGSGKWVFEEGTVEQPSKALSNVIGVPIVWRRNGSYAAQQQGPKRENPPQINPAVTELISSVPAWMDEALNMTDVQKGITSKRGESGEAVRLKLSEANVPLEDMRRDDELVLQDLLYATLVDLTNPKFMRPDQATDILGADVPQEHIFTMLRNPVTKSVRGIVVLPATLRPKTPYENKDEIAGLVTAQVIDPELGQWEMEKRGVSINTLMSLSRRKQQTEIQMLISGTPAMVSMGDHHRYHRKEIQEFIASQHWLNLDEDAQDRIQQHDEEHLQAELIVAQGEQLMQGGAQMQQRGSPPMEAAQNAAGMPPGLVGSAVNVA